MARQSEKQSRLGRTFETFESPRYAWLRRRKTRRLLVAAIVVIYAGTIALTALFESWTALVLGFILFILTAGYINSSIRGLTELPPVDLDERQESFRNTIFRKLYFPAVWTAAAGGVFVGILTPNPNYPLLGSLGMAVMGLSSGLPAIFIAWTAPDEPEDEA